MRKLLERSVPEFEGERPSIVAIANALNVSRQSVHHWLQEGIIPADRAFRLLNVTKDGPNPVTLAEIAPFVSEMDG